MCVQCSGNSTNAKKRTQVLLPRWHRPVMGVSSDIYYLSLVQRLCHWKSMTIFICRLLLLSVVVKHYLSRQTTPTNLSWQKKRHNPLDVRSPTDSHPCRWWVNLDLNHISVLLCRLLFHGKIDSTKGLGMMIMIIDMTVMMRTIQLFLTLQCIIY